MPHASLHEMFAQILPKRIISLSLTFADLCRVGWGCMPSVPGIWLSLCGFKTQGWVKGEHAGPHRVYVSTLPTCSWRILCHNLGLALVLVEINSLSYWMRKFSEEAVCRVKCCCKFMEHLKVASQKGVVTPIHILGLMQPASTLPQLGWTLSEGLEQVKREDGGQKIEERLYPNAM